MPLPSLYRACDQARAWRASRAAAYGAGLGAAAAIFKLLGPLNAGSIGSVWARLSDGGAQIVMAAGAFAIVCGAAAVARNFIARRLIWDDEA